MMSRRCPIAATSPDYRSLNPRHVRIGRSVLCVEIRRFRAIEFLACESAPARKAKLMSMTQFEARGRFILRHYGPGAYGLGRASRTPSPIPPQLRRPRRHRPHLPAATAAAPAKPFTPMDPHVAIQKADDYFNSTRTMIGDFVQISGDRRSEGKIYIQKPGKMRFEYAEPATLDIVADGMTVAVIDHKLATQDFYFIWQTPLKFLLKDQDRSFARRRRDRCHQRPRQCDDHGCRQGNLRRHVANQADVRSRRLSSLNNGKSPIRKVTKRWFRCSTWIVRRPPDPSVFQIKSSRLDSHSSRFLNRSN